MMGEGTIPREVEMFLASAGPDVRSAAGLLSASVALEPADAARIMGELWPSIDRDVAIERLGTWPFVERGADGWRVADPFIRPLSEDLEARDPAGSRRAHELLVALERSRRSGSDDDADERWFSDGRIAFYESSSDRVSAVRRLGELFARPPGKDVPLAWQWLTALALRQSWRLGEDSREIEFFHGYDAYHRGWLKVALGHMRVVAADGASDEYQALALYFGGILEGLRLVGGRIRESLKDLDSSVNLSEHLGLTSLEIDARHSYVGNLMSPLSVERMPDEQRGELFALANRLAERNVGRANEFGSPLQQARSNWLQARADWQELSSSQPPSARGSANFAAMLAFEGRKAVDRLHAIRSRLVDSGDAQAAMLASKDAATIFAQLNDTAAAIGEIEHAVEMIRLVQAPGTVARLDNELQALDEQANVSERARIRALREEIRTSL